MLLSLSTAAAKTSQRKCSQIKKVYSSITCFFDLKNNFMHKGPKKREYNTYQKKCKGVYSLARQYDCQSD